MRTTPSGHRKTERWPRELVGSIFYVALPAVWLVLAEHIIKRGKLIVSGGVTRGRVVRGVIGVTTPKDMTPQAQAQKPTRTSPGHTASSTNRLRRRQIALHRRRQTLRRHPSLLHPRSILITRPSVNQRIPRRVTRQSLRHHRDRPCREPETTRRPPRRHGAC